MAPRASFLLSAGSAPLTTSPSASLASFAGLLGRENSIPSQGQAPAAAVGVSVLDDERFGPAFLYPQAKTRQLIVPDELVRTGSLGRINGSFGQSGHFPLG